MRTADNVKVTMADYYRNYINITFYITVALALFICWFLIKWSLCLGFISPNIFENHRCFFSIALSLFYSIGIELKSCPKVWFSRSILCDSLQIMNGCSFFLYKHNINYNKTLSFLFLLLFPRWYHPAPWIWIESIC